MFHKFYVFLAVFCVFGASFANEDSQIITHEDFEDSVVVVPEYVNEKMLDGFVVSEPELVYQNNGFSEIANPIPVWPVTGSDADVKIECGDKGCKEEQKSEMVVKANINIIDGGWSGGPNIINGSMIPAGFDYECANDAEMPLMRREMMEDDGGSVLAMSRSPRKNCKQNSDSYYDFAQRSGFSSEKTSCDIDMAENGVCGVDEKEITVKESFDEESPVSNQDQIRSWVVANGQTLREVLQSWCDKEGWDLVWTTSREYPIEASAVFKGRFTDVASALIRNFGRATPVPYAKFYKGNRVIVVSTSEE